MEQFNNVLEVSLFFFVWVLGTRGKKIPKVKSEKPFDFFFISRRFVNLNIKDKICYQ